MGAPTKPKYTPDSYTVALICPMGIELAAVEGMLDDTHPSIPMERAENTYTLGQIGQHNVVVAVLPGIGTSPAATVVTQALNDFKSIRFGLLVGIGGGIPVDGEHDIRLGDVVVGKPSDTFGGVVQFDRGKIYRDGRFERTGALSKPPNLLLGTVEKLGAKHIREGNSLMKNVSAMLSKFPRMKKGPLGDPGSFKDLLFDATYFHPEKMNTCKGCDQSKVVIREARSEKAPEVHYGTIGSSNLVIKDSITRNKLYDELGVICVEMEAAGLMDEFPCLVIRGICDYADSHKNKEWQPYAAATAAAYMKEILETIPSSEVNRAPRAVESLKDPLDDSQRELRDKIDRLEDMNKILEQNNQSHAKDIESLKAELKESQKEFRRWTAGGGGHSGEQAAGEARGSSRRPEAINPSGVWVGMIRREVVDAAIKGKHDEFKKDCVELKKTILAEWGAGVVNHPSVEKFFANWFHAPRLLYGPWTPNTHAVWADSTRDDAERMLAWCDDCGKGGSYSVTTRYWTLWALFEYVGVVSAVCR
ncbi:hypothetical protein EMCG_04950 [[Emmonsia] crescens]|uniref:Nucleoside phosphorylase domain-containing protein n=1 Tax=[Emmonsia] crescens TaxID=73230 RepID=A0A0G2HQC5_9EURO|nr:hypothetical protein EMCG_04950 [Emmonsia crescens UAMH 3008]